MKIYDISQEVFSCKVYPGDRTPKLFEDMRISSGGLYNLSSFEMCAHNGTHIDAPFHFINEGKTVEQIPLEKTVGMCYVASCNGVITAQMAHAILNEAESKNKDCKNRILIKGSGVIYEDAAQVFASSGCLLIGTESQSVGPENAPMNVHKILLQEEVVLLEGLNLSAIAEGVYFLSAAPLLLGSCDGAPCRAYLISPDA